MATPAGPFSDLAQDVQRQPPLRAAITAAYRRPEPECLPPLLDRARLPPATARQAQSIARTLVQALRAKGTHGLVENLLQEYALSSQEGVALMCLAEALLRIPDTATRDALIRDKIGHADWQSHLGSSHSLSVHAATWGLLLTGRLTATSSEAGLAGSLTRLIARGGEPLIRRGMNVGMRLLGEQFVLGETIGAALANSRRLEAQGFRYSYDMLGEAALTAGDADRYHHDYEQAIHAIGNAAQGRGVRHGPGLSVKLSALHPRYARAQRHRAMTELLPRLLALLVLARHYDIGVNIDAEEADRLDLSLDLLQALCEAPALAGWHGIGFVAQAYMKRTPFVVGFLIDLARRSRHHLMIRLVKGAYWDSEIKRAQVDGLPDFPVYTRKVHTDVAYLACARTMLDATDAVFPQFATHNAQTLASILALTGATMPPSAYEFQCLHGMGEPLYEEVVGPGKRDRPCRIYAPVGTHETLLPYLVRRLLENGANTSFVNQVANPAVGIGALVADPVAAACALSPAGAPHPRIVPPHALFAPVRANSRGLDLSDEQTLAALATAAATSAAAPWHAAPLLADGGDRGTAHRKAAAGAADAPTARRVCNPADLRDCVGTAIDATPATVAAALAHAADAAAGWQNTPPAARAALLDRAADRLQARMPTLIGLIVREAGKTLPAAIGEVREAVDFLRYYASEIRLFDHETPRALGPVAAISPWNFPLSIFIGQIAGALAAGNVVLAKPAEETPLTAAAATHILHEAGVPRGALQLLPGDGAVGAALVADPRVRGVVFTGSTDAARHIQRSLAARLNPDGAPVPLIAETGGQNAMVVDSSALPEQAVTDIIASGFDSAGQRCSALRILLVQHEIADRLLDLLRGALQQQRIGRPDRLDTDIGPVITAAARDAILRHVDAMRTRGFPVFAAPLAPECDHGTFVAPTLIEIPDPSVLAGEVFGPVVHIVRYRRAALDSMLRAVNALGYGLTFGIHSRIDESIAQATGRISAGNIYVNRNIIGAVVGVQPFGGRALSGTGPKAGGPLYLRRLLAAAPAAGLPRGTPPEALQHFLAWAQTEWPHDAADLAALTQATPHGAARDLAGPVGEHNTWRLQPRGDVLCAASTEAAALRQIAAALATGNRAIVACGAACPALDRLPAALQPHIGRAGSGDPSDLAAVLYDGDRDGLLRLAVRMAQRSGPIVPVFTARPGHAYPLEFLLAEQTISVNTAAAGGNATLMTIG